METRRMVLGLYKQLLRESAKFPAYNYRLYALRRTKDAFKDNKMETNPEKIQELIGKAQKNLEIIKRQVTIERLYTDTKLVIEKPKPSSHGSQS
ncbi:LYR motif-containing protein 4-like [Lingula anatina]|uniref:LYR motif-containing protein 4-like n=1 Tax=Lingula anatina TaxID=7574 RepID=A0A1S3JLZ0_LINAN|nr:LYR motif-containing protein 4-like [Lingula anatina]|eukprot:XP_013410929.1 LYR motif-containing protein 4-like [Lingula anatina]